MKKLLCFLLTVTVICCLTFTASCKNNQNSENSSSEQDEPIISSKVILFIGDGMGENHIANTQLYYGEDMYFTGFETKVMVDTTSLSGVTDSAAGATAMATGSRTKNGYLAVDADENALTSITELAKQNRLGAGVVSSELITDATPAGFSSHAISRNNYAEILISQKDSELDLLLGRCDYKHSKLSNLFTDKGFTYVDVYSELNVNTPRIVAGFSEIMPLDNSDEVPSLTQLAVFAVEYMEKNYPDGYFLMIEGAKIDDASHDKNLQFMMQNLYDFNNAVKAVDQMLTDNYSIIVTADHETGDLKLASSKEQLTDALFLSDGHTGVNVPLYFRTSLSNLPEMLNAEVILNTQIFDLSKLLLMI